MTSRYGGNRIQFRIKQLAAITSFSIAALSLLGSGAIW